MWEHHRIRIGGDTGLPPDGCRQAFGIDPQQHKIGATGVKPVGRQMYLLRRREVNKPARAERRGAVLPHGLGQAPVVGAAEVDQGGWGRVHIASLHRSQLDVSVRHDTPVNPRGTRPKPKTSETVDIPEGLRRWP
jgi:hypothetical protein